MNLHYGFVGASKFTQEEIESNPGPRNYAIKKVRSNTICQQCLHLNFLLSYKNIKSLKIIKPKPYSGTG